MATFWRKWLVVWCWAVGLFGASLALAALPSAEAPARALLGLLSGVPEGAFTPSLRFTFAVLGAVTLGWSVTVAAAIEAAHVLGRDGRPVWRRLMAAVVVWYVVDSTLSAATGFGLNIVPNTLFLAMFMAPLLLSGVLRDNRELRSEPA